MWAVTLRRNRYETPPRESYMCDFEKPIPECKNPPSGAKVTTLLSHLLQELFLHLRLILDGIFSRPLA